MKLGIILQSNKPEQCVEYVPPRNYRTFKASHQVEIFLMNEGSELGYYSRQQGFWYFCEVAESSKSWKEKFTLAALVLKCGKEESSICPVSTMYDLPKMVESSDKVLVFG